MYHEPGTLLWDATFDDLKTGYTKDGDTVRCLVCGSQYTIGEVYPLNGHYYDAEARMRIHMEEEHVSMLEVLLNYSHDFLGISEIQQEVLKLTAAGLSDKETAARKELSPSTIRSHRFKLREKERQAKMFLTVMSLLRDNRSTLSDENFCAVPSTASMRDDRYMVTEQEAAQVIAAYFDENGHLKNCPAKEKKKIVVLRQIIKNFKPGIRYTEKEINRTLERIYEDYPYLRRLLIEYGFLGRTDSGSEYWVKE